MNKERLIDNFLQLFFPRVCPLCGEVLTRRDADGENPYICKYCRPKLKHAKKMQGTVARPGEVAVGRRLSIGAKQFFDGCIAVLEHDDNAKKILYELKYSNKRDNADFVAREAVLVLGERLLALSPDILIPVPLHKRREFERGYNQAALIAEKLSLNLKESFKAELCVDKAVLCRPFKTKPQKDLSPKERQKNVKGKFAVSKEGRERYSSCPYGTVVLVDDIFTTGATVNECARVLKAWGAKRVYVLTASVVVDTHKGLAP